jgi:phosphoribosylanthranilate isomerase
MTRIKVCGIMNLFELEAAVSAGADAVGFVIEVEGSRHSISAEAARDLIGMLPVFTKSVAVMAPKNLEGALALARRTGADVLQVHGGLAPEEIRTLRHRAVRRVIAAAAPGSEEASRLGEVADAVLLDTFKDGRLGGTGTVHDWSISAAMARELPVPVILAGGLDPSNVREAIGKVRPYAVDVSSGVETDGRKDPAKIASFVMEVRACL